ncbi:transglutaminase-like cysteine peptidase [Enterovirga aerilata]|uniref:Transglutaminase-like cysteine peptidase n=1 Tax=Enterovirga aerilata TaxID=2730920 RepID=A0A849IB48_9HYPH|nr:transglutaminase-like cysteine peptidase [Enterovirga sp. DB1703]NNM73260.1 transglutaminase-like cysteine peptidase [Enterovirga sp. DB1703]
MLRGGVGSRGFRGLTKVLAVAGAFLAVASASPSSAQTVAALPNAASIGRVDAAGSARPVQGWVKFCERYQGECDVNPAEPATVALNGRTWKALNAVNRKVNTTIKPRTDMEHWGVVDRWDLPEDGYGDCEDFQLLKRKILVEQYGFPKRAFRMTVVIDEQGEGHAVMMVRTDGGDLILDNKRSAILPWHETGYVFVKREGQDGREWVSLGEQTSPTTTANR